MQSEAEAVRAAESCVLADAERHMAAQEFPKGGTCRDCADCVRDCFDEAEDRFMRDELNARYGICIESEEHPFLVPLDQWHGWYECWVRRWE